MEGLNKQCSEDRVGLLLCIRLDLEDLNREDHKQEVPDKKSIMINNKDNFNL